MAWVALGVGHESSPEAQNFYPVEVSGVDLSPKNIGAGHCRSMAYVPLHVHTEHSALDGLARLDHVAKAISDAGMNAGAVTDHGSLGGLWAFARSAKKHGIKPIPGMEAYLSIGSRHEPETMQFYNDAGMGDATDVVSGRLKRKSYYHLTVLAHNRTGWHNLILMHNESQKTKSGKHPLIDYELLKKYGEGIVVLTGCLASPVAGPAAQTGVIAQLMLDELDLATALGPAINDAELEELESLLWDHLEARPAQRKEFGAHIERVVDRLGARLADDDHDELRQILEEAKDQANEDAVNTAVDALHDLADRTHPGADGNTLADVEDLTFDAIAAGDANVSDQHLVELTQILSELDEGVLQRDFTHLAGPIAQLRSGIIESLAADAVAAIEASDHPVIGKHPTIKPDALTVIGHTGETLDAKTIVDIAEAIDIIDHGNDRSRTAKQKKADKADLIDMLYGIIEQVYANELSESLVDGLLFMLGERVRESTSLLDSAYQATETLIDAVGKDHVFVEIMDHGITSEQYAMDHLLPMADHFDLDVVVTNDSHYLDHGDAEAHDAFLAVGVGKSLDTPGRFSFNGSGYHLMSETEVRAINEEDFWQDAVSNTQKVADMVEDDTVPEPKMRLPTFALPDGFDAADDYLRHLVEDYAADRYGDDWHDDEEVVGRIDHELSVISDMGFSDYFLITWDIMDFCERNGITTGAGRGCLTADTLVWTEQGYKPLPDISKGDIVRTHTGKHVPVTQTFVYDVHETLLNIRSWFDGRGNTMTKDHEVLILKAAVETDNRRLSGGARWGEGYDSEPIWVQAQDVEVGDFVCIPRPTSSGTAPSSFDLADFLPEVAPAGVEFTVSDDEIIESFGVNRSYDHSVRDVSKATGVSRNGLRSLIDTERSTMINGGNNAVLIKENSRSRANRQNLTEHLESVGFSSIAQWIEHTDQHSTVTTSVKRYVTVDHNFLFLLGAWASNGWIRQDSPKVVGFAERRSTADNTIPKMIEKVFGSSVTRSNHAQTDLTQWDFRSTPARALIRQLADRYEFTAQTKHLPSWVDDLDIEHKKSLLHGLWWGDGSTGGEYPRWNYSTSSAALMRQVKDLLWAVGAPAGVIEDQRTDDREEFANRSISWSIRTTENFDGSRMQASRGTVDGQYIYHRVRSIEERHDVDKVYDFTVPGDHSYMTDSYAVHNSAAGSIVSYILRIVHVCPLDNGLLFERFLERGRVGMPDIDLDFPKYQRWKIYQYVGEKYGYDHVAQIGSFQASKSRAAVRDAARVLTPDAGQIETRQEEDRRRQIFKLGDELAKILESQGGGEPIPFKDLDAMHDSHPQKVEFYNVADSAGETGRQIIELARQMEGITKGLSIHPCGFVISTEPLTDMVPLRPGATEDDPDIIIWDGDMCEDMGLLKMDFLAIQNLDYMDRTFEYLGDQGIELSVRDIPHPNDDDDTVDAAYDLLRQGRTAGLFQLDSTGMTEVVRNVAPNDLNDLSAVVALYRPGPLSTGMPADYASKKRGDKAESYAHLSTDKQEVEWLHEVLGETYQAALYQEQAMLLGRVVAGFDDKQRSTLRRAIGKKSKDLMDQVKGWWFEGAGAEFANENGNVYSPVFSDETAHRVWDFIEGAAAYSFNKSHSAAYGMVAYWTAWLKANHPVEYSAAMLAVSDNEEKRLLVIKDLIAENIPIQAPSVNTSQAGSAPVDGEVHLGLAEIRDVGKAAEKIIAERDENGPFSSLHDVATRVTGITTPALKALIEAGGMDEFGTRRGLLKNLHTAKAVDLPVDETEFGIIERDARQRIVIGTVVGSNTLDSIDLDEVSESLSDHDHGFSLDVHRLDDLDDEVHAVCHVGVVSAYKSFVSRSGRMAKSELSDSGSLPVVIFNEGYREMMRSSQEPNIGDLMVVSGQVKANTWVNEEGEEQSTQEILASRVWLPDDPTKVAEEQWQTSMLADAIDDAGELDDGRNDEQDGLDENDEPEETPVKVAASDRGDHQEKVHQKDQEKKAGDEVEQHDLQVTASDGWIVYFLSKLTFGVISENSSHLVSYAGEFRRFLIDEVLEHDQNVFAERKAVVVLSSGSSQEDAKVADQLLATL